MGGEEVRYKANLSWKARPSGTLGVFEKIIPIHQVKGIGIQGEEYEAPEACVARAHIVSSRPTG